MLQDVEQMIKEKLLEDLIEKMGDQHASILKPGLGVKVEAPDKEGLKEGLDKAKSALPSLPEEGEESHESESPENEDDESRLLALLEDDDDEDDKK